MPISVYDDRSVRRLIYSMGVSLDGYVTGPDGRHDWSVPDEELHRFHNEQTAALGAHLLGRRLYEDMVWWETEEQPGEVRSGFAQAWSALDKVVFSTTLSEVQGSARLATVGIAEEVARLREKPGGDIAVGGPGLATSAMRLGLIDEYHQFVNPIVVGGGTPFFPTLDEPIGVELEETRTFGSRVVYLRYRATRAPGSPPAAGY
jgi:dihydrofolate reductase